MPRPTHQVLSPPRHTQVKAQHEDVVALLRRSQRKEGKEARAPPAPAAVAEAATTTTAAAAAAGDEVRAPPARLPYRRVCDHVVAGASQLGCYPKP